MYFPIGHHGNILSRFEELHDFFAFPGYRCPARFGIGILFEASKIATLELKIDLLEFSLCGGANREGVPCKGNGLFVFDKRLTPNGEEGVFEGNGHGWMIPNRGREQNGVCATGQPTLAREIYAFSTSM